MKKLFAALLSSALVISMSAAPASATVNGNIIKPGSSSQSEATSVNYTVAPEYTVVIPPTVQLGEKPVEVYAMDVRVPKGKQVVVRLSDTSDANQAFKVKTDEGAELEYTVKKEEQEISVGAAILAVNPENGPHGSSFLSFETKGTAPFAGEYKGTVTFSVSVENV